MFTLLLKATLAQSAGAIVDLRTSLDNWEKKPVAGVYDPSKGGWRFDLDTSNYATGFKFKFFIHPNRWQVGNDLVLPPETPGDVADNVILDGKTYPFEMSNFDFETPPPTEPLVEFGRAHQVIFNTKAKTNKFYDVIVIGSGMAGGTVADFASDQDLNVLVLEAGGMLFPTHTGNLPRQHSRPGEFTKHIWELWDEFQVRNYDEDNRNDYKGGQGFNLGGRSLFWGGFIPRMTSWELEFWPKQIRWYLEDMGYTLAEEFMGRSTAPRTEYNRQVHLALRTLFPYMHHVDAPMAIRPNLEGTNTIATGIFSTADVLMESWLSVSQAAGGQGLDILLNHEVVRVDSTENEVRVLARDRVRDAEVSFRSKTVVISAGCIESARLAHRSGFYDPDGLIGKGTSDHPIFYTHFSIPRESPFFDPFGNVKTLSQPKNGKIEKKSAPFNMLLELGADLNQGRYLDEDIWLEHLRNRKDKMLCEIVFLCNECLNPDNQITFSEDEQARPHVSIRQYHRPNLQEQTDTLKWKLFKALGAQPIKGGKFDFRVDEARWKQSFADKEHSGQGEPGRVAHEVGSLRMEVQEGKGKQKGLVDQNCLYLGLPGENVYVCDLSIFPTTPAANPSLTVVALAIRLANHLGERLGRRTEKSRELFTTIETEVSHKAEAFAARKGVSVTLAAREAISEFIPQLAKRDADWGEDLLHDLDEFLEIAAGLGEGLDLRNSLLRAAMNAANVASMPPTSAVDAPQVRQLIQAVRQLLSPPQEAS